MLGSWLGGSAGRGLRVSSTKEVQEGEGKRDRMGTFLLPKSWRCSSRLSQQVAEGQPTDYSPAPRGKVTWFVSTGYFGGSRRCSVNPGALTSKETQARSFSLEEMLISAGQGLRAHHRKRMLRLSRTMVLPRLPQGLGSECVCGGPRGRGTPGRFGRAQAMDVRIHREGVSFKR